MSGFDDKDEINQERREKAHQEKPILINRIKHQGILDQTVITIASATPTPQSATIALNYPLG